MLWAVVTSIALTGCGAAPAAATGKSPVTPPSISGGSVRLDSATPPAGEPGQLTFSGAVNGTNPVSRQACESSGTTYRHFTLTTDGNVAGRAYFLSISIYPYRGPGVYELQPLPARPLTHDATPNPLLEQATMYPGFLNFVPKWKPGNAYSQAARAPYSTMAVDAGLGTGWIDLQMVSLNQAGESLQLRVSGRFVCGPAFTPYPEMSPR
jgi:hypothetical protein